MKKLFGGLFFVFTKLFALMGLAAATSPAHSTILVGNFFGYEISSQTGQLNLSLPISGSFSFDTSVLGPKYSWGSYENIFLPTPVHVQYDLSGSHVSYDLSGFVALQITNRDTCPLGCVYTSLSIAFADKPLPNPNVLFNFIVQSYSLWGETYGPLDQYTSGGSNAEDLNFQFNSGRYFYCQNHGCAYKDNDGSLGMVGRNFFLQSLSVTSFVPEPIVWLCMMLGIVFVGASSRIRRARCRARSASFLGHLA